MSTPTTTRRHRVRPWMVLVAGLVALFGGLSWAVVEHYRPEPWQYAASAMAPEFKALVLDPPPDSQSTRPRPVSTDFDATLDYPWEIELDEVRVHATYLDGQTLDDIERRTRDAAAALGLLDPLCRRFADEPAERVTGYRATTGRALVCNVYDSERHGVAGVMAWDNDPALRVSVIMSPYSSHRYARGLRPEDLPDP